jgi:Ca2+ transporting ATPase
MAHLETDLAFVGLTAVLDPERDAVPKAIQDCKNAGIRVIMITGDSLNTATAIAKRIGLLDSSLDEKEMRTVAFEGEAFASKSQEDKVAILKKALVFARVEPRHKMEIVSILKNPLNEVVAMTGDGVNDATALKKADIGVAMGSGTDVAREASDMVLQDDNFATIVMAVSEGRAIFANTKQFIRYLISSNIGEVACIFMTAAIGMPEALIPVQLLWVNLVTDGLPATALGFNPPDKDIMNQLPRGRDEGIVNGWMFFRYMAIGLYVGIGTVGGFIWWYLYAPTAPQNVTWAQLTNFHSCAKGGALFPAVNGVPFDCSIFHNPVPSTISLSILVLIEMFNALNALSENQSLLVVPPWTNTWVLLACGLSLTLHFVIVYVPFLANIFHVAPLKPAEWLTVLWLSFPVILIDEALKFVSRSITARRDRKEAKAGHAA